MRAVMRTASTSITSDGFNIAEARLTNAEQVAAVEIGGQNFPVGADGRLTYFLNRSETSGASRLPVRVIYSNGLSADTWMPVVDGVGGAIALPRAPKQVALMIGNSQYTGGVAPVTSAPGDAALVSNALATRFGFQPRVLKNPSKAEMAAALDCISRELGANDQLVVYYAGRSYVDQASGQGYWLPRDAGTTSARNWVSNDVLYCQLNQLGLRNTLVLSDSAFRVSTSARTLGVQAARAQRGNQARNQARPRNRPADAGPAVSVVTSGTNAPLHAIRDDSHSVFTWRLTSVLAGVENTTPAIDLFRVIRERLAGANRLALRPGDQPRAQSVPPAPIVAPRQPASGQPALGQQAFNQQAFFQPRLTVGQ